MSQEDIDIPIKLYPNAVDCRCGRVRQTAAPTYPTGSKIVLTTWPLEDEADFVRNKAGCSTWVKTARGIAPEGQYDMGATAAERFGAFAAECLRFNYVTVFAPDQPIPVVPSQCYAHPDYNYGEAPPATNKQLPTTITCITVLVLGAALVLYYHV
jgi:hypothetical protein